MTIHRIKSLILAGLKEFQAAPRVFFCFFASYFFKTKYIVIQAWVKEKHGHLIHNNWGDDINIFLIERITQKKVIVLPQTKLGKKLPMKSYVLIGSCIEYASKKHSIVYGSGLMNDTISYSVPSKSSTILAVRGKLTYKWLTDNGLICPKVFGDPALLLPRFYKPECKKKYTISFIPHHSDFEINMDIINNFETKGIHIIKVCNYTNWEDFIKDICSSEFVISSSLHGIIVSEAYGIPNVWAISKGQINGFNFKFYDFYSSIEKENVKPVEINVNLNINDLLKLKNTWKKVNIKTDALFNAFPFVINTEVYDA